jgi:polyphenol oxidase
MREPSRSRRQAHSDSAWPIRRTQGLARLESPELTRLDWLVHGFSTRAVGGSEGKGAGTLQLRFRGWDRRKQVEETRARFFRAMGGEKMRVVTLRQIHSDVAHRVDPLNARVLAKEPPRGDALFTQEPGILLAVETADCVPILLADTKRRAIAAIHSGWRGTLRRIAAKTLGRMQMEFGTRPEDVLAALGPGIGRCCYAVGSDVAREFEAQFPAARDWFDGAFDALASGRSDPHWLPWLTMCPPGHQRPSPTVNLDLIAANRAILADAGVPVCQISASGFCTACRSDLFFSYRRERTTGRMIAAIGIA